MSDGNKTLEKQLESEVSDLDKLLNELKTATSETEKKEKEIQLKKKAEKLKEKFDKLSSEELINEQIKTVKDRGDALLKACTDTLNLQDDIGNNLKIGTEADSNADKQNAAETTKASTQTEVENNDTELEEKGFFGKAKDWVGEQWDDVWNKEKWETEGGKNLLRTAGFIGTGVGAVALAYKGVKKLRNRAFGDDEDEKKSEESKSNKKDDGEMSWWKKGLLWAGGIAGSIRGGVQVYKHWNAISSRFKEKLGLALPFDEAIQKVEAEVRNGKIDDDHFGAFNAHFNGITYDENTKELCSYGQKTKIDKTTKKLDGLNVEFASWEEMIHAANIVNFAKRTLRGRGVSSQPFSLTEWGGDIGFTCSATGKQKFIGMDGSTEREWILGTLGAVGGGILGSYCAGVCGAAIGAVGGGAGGYALGAYIDNSSAAGRCCGTIARGTNLDLFITYLNNQQDENGESLREPGGEQHINPDDTPINGVIDNGKEGSEWEGVLAEIENSYGEDQTKKRKLTIERSESNPKEYIIGSYDNKLKMIIEGGPTKKGDKIDYSKITKIHIKQYEQIDGKKIESRGDGLNIDFPHTEEGLKEAIRTVNLTNMIVGDWKGKGGEAYPFAYGKYISGKNVTAFNFDIDTPGMGSNWQGGTCILTHDKLKKRYPTILKDLCKYNRGVLTGLQEKMHNQATNQDKSEGSQYIKFLHQIGKGNFWKKVG